ncbi:hypothetical protein A2U01_0051469, partial [Trifolium medium]|nr:hypothetical protein [Trifolium medium]
ISSSYFNTMIFIFTFLLLLTPSLLSPPPPTPSLFSPLSPSPPLPTTNTPSISTRLLLLSSARLSVVLFVLFRSSLLHLQIS